MTDKTDATKMSLAGRALQRLRDKVGQWTAPLGKPADTAASPPVAELSSSPPAENAAPSTALIIRPAEIVAPTPEAALVEECREVAVTLAQDTKGIDRSVGDVLKRLAQSIVRKFVRSEPRAEQVRRKTLRYEFLEEGIPEWQADLEFASAEDRRLKARLAAMPNDPPPKATSSFMGTVTALVALSIAPGLHDALASLDDSLLQWALAFALGVAVGRFILDALLPDPGPRPAGPAKITPGRYDVANGLALTFYIMRLAFVHSLAGFLLATGGAGLELVVIRAVRAKALELASRHDAWTEQQTARRGAEADVLAAADASTGLAQRIADGRREQAEIETWLKNETDVTDEKELEALAVCTLEGAYAQELLRIRAGVRRGYSKKETA